MQTWLIMQEKELLEHKTVTRVPLFICLCCVLVLISLIMNTNLQNNLNISIHTQGDRGPFTSANLQLMLSVIVGMLSLTLTTLYFAKTLRKERNEGSAAFWRSMPVSSQYTHLVKLTFGLVVIPLIFSLLILLINLLLWLASLSSDALIGVMGEPNTLASVLMNWLEFISRMLLVSLVMLPLAALLLTISQLSDSPLIILLLAGYALKLLAGWVFGWPALAAFIAQIYQLPTAILYAESPIISVLHAGSEFLTLYALLGVLALFTSTSLYRTSEISWQSLNPRWLVSKNK